MRSKFATLYLACAAIAAFWTGSNANAHRATYEEAKPALSDPINSALQVIVAKVFFCILTN